MVETPLHGAGYLLRSNMAQTTPKCGVRGVGQSIHHDLTYASPSPCSCKTSLGKCSHRAIHLVYPMSTIPFSQNRPHHDRSLIPMFPASSAFLCSRRWPILTVLSLVYALLRERQLALAKCRAGIEPGVVDEGLF